MDEYISREETIKKIEEKLKVDGLMSLAEEVWTDNCLKIVLRAITAVETADVQPVNRWISVKDRLPNIDERVFVYIPKPDNHYNREIAYISEGNDDCPYWVLKDKSQFYSTRFHYISHWMPLPEPPQD